MYSNGPLLDLGNIRSPQFTVLATLTYEKPLVLK